MCGKGPQIKENGFEFGDGEKRVKWKVECHYVGGLGPQPT